MYKVSFGSNGRQSDGFEASSTCCMVGAALVSEGAAARDGGAAAIRMVAASAIKVGSIFMVTLPWSESGDMGKGLFDTDEWGSRSDLPSVLIRVRALLLARRGYG